MPKKKKPVDPPKEEVKKDSARSKALDVAFKSLRKKFGDDVITWMGSTQKTAHEVISTGSISLDAALGIGGIVKGRIYEFYGPNASGKTTLAISVIKEIQKNGGKAIYVDAEHTLDPELMAKMGVDVEQVALVQGFTGEQNLDAAEGLMRTGEFDVCVIDSISALQPSAEANLESFDDNTMGLQPRLMSRMCRTFTPLASRTKTAMILINQIRANIGGYGKSETTSGGNAIQHHVSGRISVRGGGVKSRQIKDGQGDVIGHRVSFEITKNKLAPPFRTAEVDLIYGKGFFQEAEIFDLAVDMGFIDQSGSWFSMGETKLGQGRPKALQMVIESEEIQAKLKKDVLVLLGLSSGDNE